MPEVTRRLGELTIHFMGDNPGKLAATFDGAYGHSPRFQAEMADAAGKFRNFYVGSSLDDVASAPITGISIGAGCRLVRKLLAMLADQIVTSA
jgi:hypothetical protein